VLSSLCFVLCALFLEVSQRTKNQVQSTKHKALTPSSYDFFEV
jgi:hypothetical protein